VGAPLVTPAIVLRAVSYGESDRVVTLLGRDTGKVSAMARGARRSQRRFGGGLGLGASGEATLRPRGEAELWGFERFEIGEGRLGLGQDLGRTAHAGYVCELVDRLCAPGQAEPGAFARLEAFLGLLESRGASAARLRAFELGLLRDLGFGPTFSACAACGEPELDGATTRFSPERGGVLCEGCSARGLLVTPETRQALETLGRVPLAEADGLAFDREVQVACRGLVGELLAQHLAAPLKSLAFLQKLGA